MEDILIRVIFDNLRDKNLYNYANDESLKEIQDIRLYTNICNDLVIDFVFKNETYTIVCVKTYENKESVEND